MKLLNSGNTDRLDIFTADLLGVTSIFAIEAANDFLTGDIIRSIPHLAYLYEWNSKTISKGFKYVFFKIQGGNIEEITDIEIPVFGETVPDGIYPYKSLGRIYQISPQGTREIALQFQKYPFDRICVRNRHLDIDTAQRRIPGMNVVYQRMISENK